VNSSILYRLGLGLLFGCWGIHGIAQVITISEELPMRSDYTYTIIGWVDGDMLLFRDKGHQFYVQAFDEELHLKWEREIYLGDHKADIFGVIAHDDQFHLIYGVRNKGDYFFYHRAYTHDVSLVDSTQFGQVENVFLTPQVQVKESEDENQVVLYYEEGSSLFVTTYDIAAHKASLKHEIKLGGTNLSRDFSSMLVSNDGNFYLTLEPDKFLQKTQSLEVFHSVTGSDEVVQEELSLGESQVYDYYPVYDNLLHRFLVTGLYSERSSSRAQGFYFITLQSGNIGIHLLPFDEALLADVHGHEVSTSKGLSDFNVQKVALRQDGGAIIVAELNREFSRRSSIPMRREGNTFGRGGWVDYYYEDLILFAVHPDGTEHWKEVLRKRQYSQDDDAMYSSFFLFKTPSRLRFLFNDEIKQENTVGGYEVTGTGHVERKTVFNTDYQRLKLRFKDGLQLAYNECIVPSERNGRLSLVRIVYNDD
jgi:hypothetical protein